MIFLKLYVSGVYYCFSMKSERRLRNLSEEVVEDLVMGVM